MHKLINWLDSKSMHYLSITMKLQTIDPEWSKANEMYKFYDDIKFNIVGLEGLYQNRQNFVTDIVLNRLRHSHLLKTIHSRLTNANEGFDFDRKYQQSY